MLAWTSCLLWCWVRPSKVFQQFRLYSWKRVNLTTNYKPHAYFLLLSHLSHWKVLWTFQIQTYWLQTLRNLLCITSVFMAYLYWPALRAGLLCCNFFGQPGSVSKFPPFVWVKLWVGWVGRGYTKISRYFPASWINWVTLVTKIKLLYSLRF